MKRTILNIISTILLYGGFVVLVMAIFAWLLNMQYGSMIIISLAMAFSGLFLTPAGSKKKRRRVSH